jgi:hypothetical protein
MGKAKRAHHVGVPQKIDGHGLSAFAHLPHCHFDQREKSSRVPELSAPARIPRSARNDNGGNIKKSSFPKNLQKPYTTSDLRFPFKHSFKSHPHIQSAYGHHVFYRKTAQVSTNKEAVNPHHSTGKHPQETGKNSFHQSGCDRIKSRKETNQRPVLLREPSQPWSHQITKPSP